MDLIGLILVFFGVVALCMGVYELAKQTIVGRNTSASTPEQIRKFSKIDGICYIIEGLAAILLAFSDYIPFLAGKGTLALGAIVVITMIVNFILARKYLNNFPAEAPKENQKP